jgi:hypothetical protein
MSAAIFNTRLCCHQINLFDTNSQLLLIEVINRVSAPIMKRDETIRVRQKLLDQLPISGEMLRGALFQRSIRHTRGCPKCAGGGGHPLWVLSVSYQGQRTRQFSLRHDQIAEVRRWLRNYQELKTAIEAICELNLDLLRPDLGPGKSRRKTRD